MIRTRTLKRQRQRIRHHHLNEGDGERDIALSPGSVDTQIDSLLVSFEKEAAELEDNAVVPEGRSIMAMLLLLEADEQADDENDENDDKDSVTTDERQKTDEPADTPDIKVNIDTFALRVATLIETYTQRLDVETVIFNRAVTYMREHHGEQAAANLTRIITDEHGINLQGGSDDVVPVQYGAGSGQS